MPIPIVLACSLAAASSALPPRFYEVTTVTAMPHLEENLRYATTHAKRCLAYADLATASTFPVLSHAALKGCRLGEENRQADSVSYALICEGGHGTTGSAVWRIGEQQMTGTLSVKLGGKNFTFYQRVTARVLGACAAVASVRP
ncbi:MAG TPA: hypothetical protein VEZ88_09100 [Steroidobacteraceae bacterium]|nr:hypothetical protein [Steroidobacteraceae bacterium]